MMQLLRKTVLLTGLLLLTGVLAQTKRGRNEGTINVGASNVIGNGNITLHSTIDGRYGTEGFGSRPDIGLKVGIASIIQLTGKVTVEDFTRLGVAQGHVQLTTPGNDRLRFIGAAISGDLYLSSKMDTLSGTAISGRPEYNSYIRASLIADVDWIARYEKLPLKTYMSIGFADNPDLLFRYAQLAMRLGCEMKYERNSFAVDVGAGFYKEKKSTSSGAIADRSYAQKQLWVEPSVRFRFLGRHSMLLGIRALLFQSVKTVSPLPAEYLRVSSRIEVPIVFKETNSEAIRTMLFVETRKKTRNDVRAPDSTAVAADDSLNISIDGMNLDIIKTESEAEVLKRREEIREKMDEIELLLEDLE